MDISKRQLYSALFRLVNNKDDRTRLYEWLKEFTDASKIEKTDNKTKTITTSSTDEQYPTAKAVYDFVTSRE